MRDLFLLALHLIVTVVKLLRPGGVRAVAAESLLLKQQLIVINRSRQRAPNLTSLDRLLFGLLSLLVRKSRIPKLSVALRPSTLLRIHKALIHRKYRLIFSSASRPRKPGPKGPSAELIAAIVALKQLNPMFGCVKIAQQISHAFGLNIDKDVVRRVLVKNYRPTGSDGPSWLTFLAQAKDSLWSVDFFQCESINLCTFCVMVVIDVFSRRIIGFGIERYPMDGAAVCRMFNHAVSGKQLPQYLSTDRDPLFRFHRWLANLRIHEIEEIKAVPFMPTSHPFVERLIGTLRQEYLDRLFFWNAIDLERKLQAYAFYYNNSRLHQSLNGKTPDEKAGQATSLTADLTLYNWQEHCQGLFYTPTTA